LFPHREKMLLHPCLMYTCNIRQFPLVWLVVVVVFIFVAPSSCWMRVLFLIPDGGDERLRWGWDFLSLSSFLLSEEGGPRENGYSPACVCVCVDTSSCKYTHQCYITISWPHFFFQHTHLNIYTLRDQIGILSDLFFLFLFFPGSKKFCCVTGQEKTWQ
jgi:hypothetical protein